MAQSQGHNTCWYMYIFSIFFNMNVCCAFSLESPHLSDSNKYTQYTFFNTKKENHLKLSQICSYGMFSMGAQNEFETAVVNEPPVFEPLKVCCITFVADRKITFQFRSACTYALLYRSFEIPLYETGEKAWICAHSLEGTLL